MSVKQALDSIKKMQSVYEAFSEASSVLSSLSVAEDQFASTLIKVEAAKQELSETEQRIEKKQREIEKQEREWAERKESTEASFTRIAEDKVQAALKKASEVMEEANKKSSRINLQASIMEEEAEKYRKMVEGKKQELEVLEARIERAKASINKLLQED